MRWYCEHADIHGGGNERRTLPLGKWKLAGKEAHHLARNIAEADGAADHAGIAMKEVLPFWTCGRGKINSNASGRVLKEFPATANGS
jgi:hypothetical protein